MYKQTEQLANMSWTNYLEIYAQSFSDFRVYPQKRITHTEFVLVKRSCKSIISLHSILIHEDKRSSLFDFDIISLIVQSIA